MSTSRRNALFARLAVLVATCWAASLVRADDGSVIYVDQDLTGAADGTSWDDAFFYVQSALAAAGPGDEIWVAAGTYMPDFGTRNPTLSFEMANGAALLGGFAGTETSSDERDPWRNKTILSGGITDDFFDAKTCHVLTATETSDGTVVDGFTITRGRADAASCADERGGGVLVNGGNITFRRCVIAENETTRGLGEMDAGGKGAGICADGATVTFVDSIISRNSSGVSINNGCRGASCGGGVFNNSIVAFVNCDIRGNAAGNGFGVFGSGCDGGSGGGLCSHGSELTIINSIVANNEAGGGGFDPENNVGGLGGDGGAIVGDVTAINSVFFNNRSGYGGKPGLGGDGGAILGGGTFINCTFANNATIAGGPGGAVTGSTATSINNSVFWDNAPNAFGEAVSVSYSIIQGGWPGVGNRSDDPQFFDASFGDLRLRAGSPGIDAGSNAALPQDTFDLDGDGDVAEDIPIDLSAYPRRYDDVNTADTGEGVTPIVDIGAYEFVLDCNLNRIADAVDIADGTSADDDGDGRPDECDTTVLRVDTRASGSLRNGLSWATAFADLNNATDHARIEANRIDEVWVAAGTYTPSRTADPAASFRFVDGLEVYGGFAGGETERGQRDFEKNVTILSGDLYGNDTPEFGNRQDNSDRIVSMSGGSDEMVLDGFTVRGGYNFSDGVGILATGGHRTIRNCSIIDHWGRNGVGLSGDDGALFVENCAFEGNSGSQDGGAIRWGSGTTTLVNSEFTANTLRIGRRGGAVYTYSSAVTIARCLFDGNTAGDAFESGGGIYFYDCSDAVVDDCIFANNAAGFGGAIAFRLCEPVIGNSSFAGNSATQTGGAISGDDSSQYSFVGNALSFHGNSARIGGAIAAKFDVHNSVFFGNEADFGGAVRGAGSLDDCVLVGNRACRAGALSLHGDSTVGHCTLASNVASCDDGGGIRLLFASARVAINNSIIWANGVSESSQIDPNGGDVAINYSAVQGWSGIFGGVGNIGADPLFVDRLGPDGSAGTDDDDLRLLTGSPCIDTGDPAFDAAGVASDLDGNPRVLCDRVDMGAYEFVGRFGDFHDDQTIDLFDFGAFAACQAGPGQAPFSESCDVFDMDCDDDVDFVDFGRFQILYEQRYP